VVARPDATNLSLPATSSAINIILLVTIPLSLCGARFAK
jgi:hypothetical protein